MLVKAVEAHVEISPIQGEGMAHPPPPKIVKIKFNHTPSGENMYNLRVLIFNFLETCDFSS